MVGIMFIRHNAINATTTQWEKMVYAISKVESQVDDLAYNKKSGALGRYQMKKIYVDEVNRILSLRKSKKRYAYSDRTDPKKAREMFDIYQSHHNPKKSISRAIRLHRGIKSTPYEDEVKRIIREKE